MTSSTTTPSASTSTSELSTSVRYAAPPTVPGANAFKNRLDPPARLDRMNDADLMNDAVFRLLQADGPHPDLGDHADLYGRLIGSWDIDNNEYDETTGEWQQYKRECHFRWVLDGRIVQDLWGSPERGFGTTVRAYDSNLEAWRVHWFAPKSAGVCTLIGRADGDRIAQEGTQQDGRPIRWSIVDITPDSFTWLGEISDDGGDTWRLEQEMKATRRH